MDRAPQQPWLVPDEWEIEEDRARKERYAATRREYERRPEVIARKAEYRARPEVRERRRIYFREYQRRRRAQQRANRVGFLHELACTGNHHGSQRCRPIPVYRGEAA